MNSIDKNHDSVNKNIFSIDTETNGATRIQMQSGLVVLLSPKAAAELADHLMNALNVTITLRPHGRYVTSATAPEIK